MLWYIVGFVVVLAYKRWLSVEPPHCFFVNKEISWGALQEHFTSEANEQGKANWRAHNQAMRAALTAGANAANSAKHPKDKHGDLYKDFREVGDSSHFNISEALNNTAQCAADKCVVLLLTQQPFVILKAKN